MKEVVCWAVLLAAFTIVGVTSANHPPARDAVTDFIIEPPKHLPCQSKKLSIIFIVERFYFSALWNAYDISRFLSDHKDRYPDIQSDVFLNHTSFKALDRKDLFGNGDPNQKVDLCVFLKAIQPNKQLTRQCKRMGAKTAILLDDVIPIYFPSLAESIDMDWIFWYDYIITVNSYTRTKIQEFVTRKGTDPADVPKIWVIPVHLTNYQKAKHPDPSRAVRVIGWQGSAENRMSEELRARIQSYCRRKGLEFREEYFPFPPDLPKGQQNIPGLKQILANEFTKISSTFDIFVLFPPPGRFANVLYKSASRFLFALSMGIPTIAYPFLSYFDAMVHGQTDYPAMASSEDELFRWLDYLVENKEARVALASKGLKLAERFEPEQIMDIWAHELRSAFCKDVPTAAGTTTATQVEEYTSPVRHTTHPSTTTATTTTQVEENTSPVRRRQRKVEL